MVKQSFPSFGYDLVYEISNGDKRSMETVQDVPNVECVMDDRTFDSERGS